MAATEVMLEHDRTFSAMQGANAKKCAMKTAKDRPLTKGDLANELAKASQLKKSDITKVLNGLAEIGADQLKNNGKFVLPGLLMMKARLKPGRKAGKRMMFGREVAVKAKPTKRIVRATPVASLRNQMS